MHLTRYFSVIFSLFVALVAFPQHNTDSIKTLQQARSLFSNNLASPEEYQNTIQALDVIANSEESDSIGRFGAIALSRYAWMLMNESAQDLALPLFRRALEYCPPNDSVMFYDIMSGIGGIHLLHGKTKEAMEVISKSLNYHSRVRDSLGMVKDYYNIATLYKRIDKPSTALPYAQKALDLAEKSRNYVYQSHILNFISGLQPSRLLEDSLLSKADSINYANNYNLLTADNRLRRAEFFFGSGDYTKALDFAEKSMAAAQKYGQWAIYISALRLKARIYAELNDYPRAYFNLNLAADKEDENRENNRKLMAARGEYATRLLDWCDDNIVMRHGRYVARRPVSAATVMIILAISFIVVSLTTVLILKLRKRRRLRAELEKEKTDSEIRELKSEGKHMRDIIGYLMFFYNNQNVLLEKIRAMVKQGLSKDSDPGSMLRKIGSYAASNMLDKIDEKYTLTEYDDGDEFLKRLQKTFPEISEVEKNLAVYLRAGLSTHEICVITGNQPRSVNMTRYRLRKRLQLGDGENLEEYLKSL